MSFVEVYAIGAVVILAFRTAVWIASLIMKDSSIVDIFWGTGFAGKNSGDDQTAI